MIKIYVDKSLNMPLGKLCAQVSHGLMAIVLDRFTINEEQNLAITDKDSYNWFIKNYINEFEFELIFTELTKESVVNEIKSSGTYSIIMDSGRTCFNGVKTFTVIAKTDDVLIDHKRAIQSVGTEQTDNESRQILLLDRTIDLDSNKDEIIKTAAKASLHNLLVRLEPKDDSVYFDLSKDNSLKDWLLGSFAKITLSVKGQTKLSNSVQKVIEANIPFHSERFGENSAITAFGPCRKIDSLSLTKRMQLL